MIIRKDGTAAVSFVDPADGTRKHADVEGWRKVGTQTAEGGAKYSRFGGEQRRPEDFVPAPDGSLDFGHITDEVAAASNGRFPAAPIRLQEGTPETLGRAHVEIDKSERIKAAGYEDEISYIADVTRNYSEVWELEPTETHPQGSLLLVKARDAHHDVSSVELVASADGQYYTVVTAFPVRQSKKYPPGGGRTLLWRREPTLSPGLPGTPTRFTSPSATEPGEKATGGTGQNNAPGRPDGDAPQSDVRNALPSADENIAPKKDKRYSRFGAEERDETRGAQLSQPHKSGGNAPSPEARGGGADQGPGREPLGSHGPESSVRDQGTSEKRFGTEQRLGDVKLSEADKQKVKDKLRAILRQLAPKANLAFVDDLVDGKATGKWEGLKSLVTVSLGYGDPEVTLRHEAIHALRRWG